jgi:hypothetical protein
MNDYRSSRYAPTTFYQTQKKIVGHILDSYKRVYEVRSSGQLIRVSPRRHEMSKEERRKIFIRRMA